MNREDFIKKIIEAGVIDKKLHYEARNKLGRNSGEVFFTKCFLMTLQEIDSSVYKYYVPMDIDYSEIFNNQILFFNIKDLMDMNEQKSVFLASNQNNLKLANEYTQKKLDIFFKKPRFHSISFDLYLKTYTSQFIYEFVDFKGFNLFIKSLN